MNSLLLVSSLVIEVNQAISVTNLNDRYAIKHDITKAIAHDNNHIMNRRIPIPINLVISIVVFIVVFLQYY